MRSGLLPLPSGPAHCNSQGRAAALEPAPYAAGQTGVWLVPPPSSNWGPGLALVRTPGAHLPHPVLPLLAGSGWGRVAG